MRSARWAGGQGRGVSPTQRVPIYIYNIYRNFGEVVPSRYVVGIVDLRAGHAPPLRVAVGCVFFRGGGRWFQCEKEGSRPLPTSNRMKSGYRQSTYFRQVCRGRIHASRAVCPLGYVVGTAATGGIYAAPTSCGEVIQSRNVAGIVGLRAGHAPPLPALMKKQKTSDS